MLDKIESILKGPSRAPNLEEQYLLIMKDYPHLLSFEICASLKQQIEDNLKSTKQNKMRVSNIHDPDHETLFSEHRVHHRPLSEKQIAVIQDTVSQWTNPIIKDIFNLYLDFPFLLDLIKSLNLLFLSPTYFQKVDEKEKNLLNLTIVTRECAKKEWILNLMRDCDTELGKFIFNISIEHKVQNMLTFDTTLLKIRDKKLRTHLQEIQNVLVTFRRSRFSDKESLRLQWRLNRGWPLSEYKFNYIKAQIKNVKNKYARRSV